MNKRTEIARLRRKALESAMFSDVEAISRIMDELSAAAAGGAHQPEQSLAEILNAEQEPRA